MRYSVLAVLLLMGVAYAADLSVAIIDSSECSSPLHNSVINCLAQGGPNHCNVIVTITNPSSNKSLRVSYLYYNSSSGQLEDGGKVCDIGAGLRGSCTFAIKTITGGKNGTDAMPFKIVGWVGEVCGNGEYCAGSKEYDATLNVVVNHSTGGFEQNVLSKVDTARSEYARVSAQYTSDCYNMTGFYLLQNASSETLEASNKLSICDIRDALNLTNDAINKIHQADGNAKLASCAITPPVQNNSQPPQPPPENNTTQVPQNETLNETQNETSNTSTGNMTNITSALVKGCIPFYMLAALLVAAVWSERKHVNA